MAGMDRSVLAANTRISLQPTRGLEVSLKSINLLNCAVGPFGFDGPSLAITKHQAEYRFNWPHFRIYVNVHDGCKTNM